MGRLVRRWSRLLVGLVPVGLLLVGCTSATGKMGEAAPRGDPTAVVNLDEHRVASSILSSTDEPVVYRTVNVDLTDDGIQPSSLFIPAGQRVQLVVRNRGTTEHQFRVRGLVPRDLLRLARDDAAVVTEDDHHGHHGARFVESLLSTSNAGIVPMGNEVHAFARGGGGGMDVVLFTPTTTGTFQVQCPLHPGIVGKLTVF